MIVHKATTYQDWTSRMMADVGDLIGDIAAETRQAGKNCSWQAESGGRWC